MNEPKPFASLSPSLLARKGGARPAMRPQLQPLIHSGPQFHEATARQIDDDLGWNDMGHDVPEPVQHEAPAQREADIVAFKPSASLAPPKASEARVPEVVKQQAAIADRVAEPAAPKAAKLDKARRSALSDGRRAAFTLRLDAERHLKLRLACTIANRSAQQIVTDALDQFIAGLPDVATLAAQVKKRG